MASLNRGISFRRQGSSGLSWTDTWSFNEEGVLVRTMKEEVQQLQQQQQQRFTGSALARIHDSHTDEQEHSPPSPLTTCPRSPLTRSKSVGGAGNHRPLQPPKPSPKFFKWIRRALKKLHK